MTARGLDEGPSRRAAHPDPAVTVTRIGYVGFQTPDVDRLVAYYTDVLDFSLVHGDSRRAFLAAEASQHWVAIERSPVSSDRSFVGYEVREDLSSARRRLLSRGYAAELRGDADPSAPAVLVVLEPLTGTPVHLLRRQRFLAIDLTGEDRLAGLTYRSAPVDVLSGVALRVPAELRHATTVLVRPGAYLTWTSEDDPDQATVDRAVRRWLTHAR